MRLAVSFGVTLLMLTFVISLAYVYATTFPFVWAYVAAFATGSWAGLLTGDYVWRKVA